MSLKLVVDAISSAMDWMRKPFTQIPAIILLCSLIRRPGACPMLITANIIRRHGEIGIPSGANTDGSRNLTEAYTKVIVDEIFNALREDAVVQVVLPPGSISVISTGGNAGGPITTIGFNDKPVTGYGLLRVEC